MSQEKYPEVDWEQIKQDVKTEIYNDVRKEVEQEQAQQEQQRPLSASEWQQEVARNDESFRKFKKS